MDELVEARETIARLNRRVQAAEAALADARRVIDSLTNGKWAGGSLGRALLAWENEQLRRQLEGK